jgi:hypothetical protein
MRILPAPVRVQAANIPWFGADFREYGNAGVQRFDAAATDGTSKMFYERIPR